MDDLILLSESKDELNIWMLLIEKFLKEKLDLSLHPAKRIIAPISNGIDFVGYVVRPNYMLVRKRVVANLKHRIWAKTIDKEGWNSYMAHFKYAQSKRLKLNLIKDISKNGLLEDAK